MPSNKNILILEDDPTRIDWIMNNFKNCSITWHTSVNEFIVAFIFGNWDLVIYDYDLTPTHAVPVLDKEKGLWLLPYIDCDPWKSVRFDYDKDDLNGLDGAKMIPHASINDTWSQRFLIWSQNKDGAGYIEKALKDNGYTAIIRHPYNFYSNEKLKIVIERLLA